MSLSEISSIDKYAFLILNGKHAPVFDFIMHASSNMLVWCPLYAAILYCCMKIFNNNTNSFENSVLNVIMIILLTLICINVFPPVIDKFIPRLKPCHNPDIYMSVRLVGTECGADFGFFAYRVCFAFALSTYLFITLPRNFNWLKIILILWAVLISYSRIYVGVHYPLDVLAASFVGVISGISIYLIYNYFKNSLFLI